LINGDYCAAAILITFGGLLGKTNLTQLIVVEIIEIILYCLNLVILLDQYKVADIGGSMVIHMFGAYFGLSAALVMNLTGKND
jgi:ammonium transporter Rh